MKVVVVGGVAGGMSAAARLRRLDSGAQIVVLERSGYVSYANCGLPYYLGGVIEDEADLLLQTPASLRDRFRIDVRVNSAAVGIDRLKKTVSVVDLSTGQGYDEAYDVLILSPGASPIVPRIPGGALARPLRTVEDVQRLATELEASPRRAAVIGGGFIGVEVAENLVHRGVDVTVVEAADQVLAPVDPEMAGVVADELRRRGVDLRLGDTVTEITATGVRLASGTFVEADLTIAAIGMRPETDLAIASGLDVGARGGVVVDEFQRTSDLSIYCVGDAAEKSDALDGSAVLVPLANLANRHGRVVADHIAGRAVRPRRAIGTVVVRVFGLTVAATGWNEKRLRAAGRDLVAIHTHPTSHASYYPGGDAMSLKLLVDPSSGEILGAQAVGGEGVDKRIDVVATAMFAGLRAPELADLELAYAPPFGSAKDPVNMLGYVAENVLTGLVQTVQWSEVAERRAAGAALIDVRTPDEFATGSLPGALNIPVDDLRERWREIDALDVVVYCEVGQRGHVAARLLSSLGFRASNLDGGYRTWSCSPASVLQTTTI
ncbi:MAG: FAD-dependent oxidoreductase [Acidimicrobiales bacterium]